MNILWIPHTGWHIPQRAHLFCHVLAERHQVHVTDWVADFTTLRDYLSQRYLRNFFYRCRSDGAITVHGIPRISPALYVAALRRFNARLFSCFIQRIIAEHNIDVVVGTFVVPPPAAPRLVFDLFDNNAAYWRAFGRNPQYAAEIDEIEKAYLQSADAVVAASSVLADRVRAQGPRGPVHLIPNGVDLRRFETADGHDIRARLGVRGRLVGAVGNHDKPVELDRILGAAKHFTGDQITFLIAGRGMAVPEARKRAEREGLLNVKFTGYLPPEEAPCLIAALDVGLCPYAKTPAADASSPMRLLMYSAAGLPVVCTELEEVRRMNLPNVVLVDDSVEALVDGIRCALQLPKARPPQLAQFDLARLTRRYEAVLCGRTPDDE